MKNLVVIFALIIYLKYKSILHLSVILSFFRSVVVDIMANKMTYIDIIVGFLETHLYSENGKFRFFFLEVLKFSLDRFRIVSNLYKDYLNIICSF